MGRGSERLERMRQNPKDDWRIGDVQVVCNEFAINLRQKSSHFTVSHPTQKRILTIPAHRAIKPFYIKQFIQFVNAVKGASNVG